MNRTSSSDTVSSNSDYADNSKESDCFLSNSAGVSNGDHVVVIQDQPSFLKSLLSSHPFQQRKNIARNRRFHRWEGLYYNCLFVSLNSRCHDD